MSTHDPGCKFCGGKGTINKWVQVPRKQERATHKPRGEYRDFKCPNERIPDHLLTEPTAEVIR